MPNTPTPGQVNYAAFCAFWAMHGLSEPALFAWSALTAEMQAAWEAAAQAVLADATAHVRAVVRHWNEFGPEYDFAVYMDALERWLTRQEETPHA